jgi:hypothetical protein
LSTPVHLLKSLFYLTPEELNKKMLNDKKASAFYDGRWSIDSQENGIFFDLSQVRWINIGAAALLTLWIERAKKDNIQVFVALPYKEYTTKEREKTEKDETIKEIFKSILKKRQAANSFLKTLQFDRAIICNHIENDRHVFISERFEFSSNTLDENQFTSAFKEVYSPVDTVADYSLFRYKYLVPFTWIDSRNEEKEIRDLNRLFEEVLTNQDRGIEQFDVLALRNVLLSEMLKNVKEHAGRNTNHALLAIGLMPIKSLKSYQKDISKDSKKQSTYTEPIEQNYIEWLLKSKFNNFIELYFGDSGVGILDSGLDMAYEKNNPKELKTNLKILEWSFDKWSTRKEEQEIRGTKGLYRIKRIVDKYEGLILVKTGDMFGGFQKGGNLPAKFIPEDSSHEHVKNMIFPGTFIQIKLCTYKEVSKLNFNFNTTEVEKSWSSVFHELSPSNSFADWINQEKSLKEDYNVLLILESKDTDNQQIQNHLLDLKHLSFIRHKSAFVVFLINDIGNDLLGTIAESINETLDFQSDECKPDYETIYSPILLIGKNNKIYWFGKEKLILNMLNEIYELKSTNLSKIPLFNSLSKEDQYKINRYFHSDSQIIQIDSNNELTLNFSNIQSIIHKHIESNIDRLPKSLSAPICTPKLTVVNEWYDIKSILYGYPISYFALGLYLKFREKFQNFPISQKTTHILIDHNQQYELANEFAKLLGVNSDNIINTMEDVDDKIPRRTKLFNKNDDVIIITTIISSSETVRRLVKFTKRDSATPVIILCLVDKREKIKPLETWGSIVDILSIYEMNIKNAQQDESSTFDKNRYNSLLKQIEKCNTYISPAYKKEETSKKYKIDQNLRGLLMNNKAIHYNHIGNVNDRHFTFYFDKKRILGEKTFVWDKYLESVKDWISKNSITKFYLFIPQNGREEEDLWKGCSDYIKTNIGNNITIEFKAWNADKSSISREMENIVCFDFGTLTGSSINHILGSLYFPENVLIVVLFSQFKDDRCEFYKKIRCLEYSKKERFSSEKLSLFGEEDERTEEKKTNANVRIDFLVDLPIDIYNSSTCPICEHERMLELYKMGNKYMIDFCDDRKKRLKIKDRKRISEHRPFDFYNTEDEGNYTELSSMLIMKMFELKTLLDCAKTNTHNRVDVLKFLVDIVNNFDTHRIDCESELYAFLFFVSHEVLWFQKEPLVFREVRTIVTELARRVAVYGLSDLIADFMNNSLNNEQQCEKIAVRYKYAAITVLRSANKATLCENIFEIIKSSQKSNKSLSNNLVQNTIYHIHSLQSNVYNRSKIYFDKIQEQFEILSKEELPFSIEQESALNDIKYNNNFILQSFDDKGRPLKFNTCQEQFKHYRDQFMYLYTSRSHPVFYSKFQALDFYGLKGLDDVEKNTTSSPFWNIFKNRIDKATENWSFIERILLPVVGWLPKNIFQTTYFHGSIFFSPNYEELLKKFSNLIQKVTMKNFLDKKFREAYTYLYSSITLNPQPRVTKKKTKR